MHFPAAICHNPKPSTRQLGLHSQNKLHYTTSRDLHTNAYPSPQYCPNLVEWQSRLRALKWLLRQQHPRCAHPQQFRRQPITLSYYFTMSFDATVPLPSETLTFKDLSSIPFKFPLSLAHDPLNLSRTIAATWTGVVSKFPGVPNIVSWAKWAVQVANNHLGLLDYFDSILLLDLGFRDRICCQSWRLRGMR